MKKVLDIRHKIYPIVVIDNWYNEQELEDVWKEINFYSQTDKMQKADQTNVARTLEGKPLSNNLRVFPDEVLKDKQYSIILNNYLPKIQSKEFHDIVKTQFHHGTENETYAWFGDFANTNISTSMLSYYDESTYYGEHHDTFKWTMIIFLYKETKNFTGGDFNITRGKIKIECKSNRLLLFPSWYHHSVDEIKLIDKDKKFSGKWAIVYMLGTVPQMAKE